MELHQELLLELAHCRMPYGKYKGRYLDELPEAYLVWFRQQGWPDGTLGMHLQTIYEVKLNGLEGLIRKVRAHA